MNPALGKGPQCRRFARPSPGSTRSGLGGSDTRGLRGVSSVWVLIESPGPEEVNIGLADDTVRTDVERAVDRRRPSSSIWTSCHLLRNSLSIGTAFTWTDMSTLLRPSLHSVHSEIKDLGDKFLNEWLKQNPRR
jgi:hypothetical protein